MYTIDIHESYSRIVMRNKVKVRIQYFFKFLNLIFLKNQLFFHSSSLNFIQFSICIYIFHRMYHYIKDRLFLDCSIIFEMYIIIFITLLHIQCYYFYYYFKPYVYIIHIFPFKSGYCKFAF